VERDKYIITIPLDNKPLKETTKDTLFLSVKQNNKKVLLSKTKLLLIASLSFK
jgi:hypothetical protein